MNFQFLLSKADALKPAGIGGQNFGQNIGQNIGQSFGQKIRSALAVVTLPLLLVAGFVFFIPLLAVLFGSVLMIALGLSAWLRYRLWSHQRKVSRQEPGAEQSSAESRWSVGKYSESQGSKPDDYLVTQYRVLES